LELKSNYYVYFFDEFVNVGVAKYDIPPLAEVCSSAMKDLRFGSY
jgi:hypothetical protein